MNRNILFTLLDLCDRARLEPTPYVGFITVAQIVLRENEIQLHILLFEAQ